MAACLGARIGQSLLNVVIKPCRHIMWKAEQARLKRAGPDVPGWKAFLKLFSRKFEN
jgi:hypothetical protein